MNARRIIMLGFLVILLVGIPLTIYLVQKQQENRSRAQKSTTVSFAPDSSSSNPIQKNINDSIPVDVMVSPGTNLVSFVKLEVDYDPHFLSIDSSNGFQANTSVFPSVLEGPIYAPGKITVTLSVGPDPTKALQTTAKAATLTFKAVADTPGGSPTTVTYGVSTQVLSIGASDQASENVLSSTNPATIVIGTNAVQTPTPTTGIGTTPTGTPTGAPTTTPTPVLLANATGTPTDTPAPTAISTVVPTNTPTPTTSSSSSSNNQSPICSSLTIDRSATGQAPYAITFTGKGSDSDGTVTKANFTYGDGAIDALTSGGGLGSSSVNTSISHTYTQAGSYVASVIFTDNSGAFSDSTNCTQTITVTSGGSSGINTTSGSSNGTAVSITPTIGATGSITPTIGFGALALLLIVGGGFLFFVL